MLVEMKMPCRVSYLPPKCRKPRQGLVWKKEHVSIDAPDVSEAPLAYRIAPTSDGRSTPTFHEIRSFEGQLWWPLQNREGKPMGVAVFKEGLAAGKHESLHVLNPDWIFFSGHQSPYEELFAKPGFRITYDQRDAAFAEAQRGAARIMFCGDVVHVLGGRPVFFGCRAHGLADGAISLRVGSLLPIGRLRYAGPTIAECDLARYEGLVLGADSLRDDVARLRSNGYPVGHVDGIEILDRTLPVDNEAIRVSADAVVRRLFQESTDVFSRYRHLFPEEALEKSELLPLEICRETLTGVVERAWRKESEFPEALSCAAMVEQRLRRVPKPPLDADDDDALGSLGP